MTKYSYEPLPRIELSKEGDPHTRLLVLSPGQESDALRCDLEPLDLNKPISYEAVSYVWGAEKASWTIYCRDGNIVIRPNLAVLLRSLRLLHQSRRLWVDALCIDQLDLEERSRQVDNMRHIYKSASRSVVWLGLKTRGVEIAFSLAGRIAEIQRLHDHDSNVMDILCELLYDVWDARNYLTDLLYRPLFKRMWCVQEILVCRESIAKCGDLEINLRNLLASMKCVFLTIENISPYNTLEFWAHIYTLKYLESQGYSWGVMLELLARCRAFEATDPRDKIFTILGISEEGLRVDEQLRRLATKPRSVKDRLARRTTTAKESAINFVLKNVLHIYVTPLPRRHPALIPDYTRDIVDIYCNHTRYMVHYDFKTLETLSHVEHERDPTMTASFPSWVPKWFEPDRSQPMGTLSVYEAGCKDTARKEVYRVDDPRKYFETLPDVAPEEARVLRLDGVHVDTVCATTNVLAHEAGSSSNWKATWTQLFNLKVHDHSYVRNQGESLELAFYHTFSANALTTFNLLMDRKPKDKRKAFINVYSLRDVSKSFAPAYIAATAQGNSHITGTIERSSDSPSSTTGGKASIPPHTQRLFSTHEDDNLGVTNTFIRSARAFSHNRRMYTTSAGRIGLGPKSMRPGDKVVILRGGRTPFVLRSAGETEAVGDLLIGEIYVHDDYVMWGQFFRDIQEGRKKDIGLQIFHLV